MYINIIHKGKYNIVNENEEKIKIWKIQNANLYAAS